MAYSRLFTFTLLSFCVPALAGCAAGMLQSGTGMDCVLLSEITPTPSQPNLCPGMNGIKVYFERPPSEALGTFVSLLERNNVSIAARHPNGVESGPWSPAGMPMEIRYKARVEETGSGSVLLISGYRENPSTGKVERIVVTPEDFPTFEMMATPIHMAYENSQIRYAKNVPEITF